MKPKKPEAPTLPVEGFVRFRTICQFLPMARSTWEKGVREGVYPPGYDIGPGMKGWLAMDVRETIAQIKRGEVPHWPPERAAA